MNKIFLTVDVESHDLHRENQYVWGKCRTGEYGIKYILEQGEKYKIPINFFLDFAEENAYGEYYIEQIKSVIESYGQPIFLHLHPDFLISDSRSYLWEYSKEEQKKILEQGIALYVKHMGKKPAAFRAGRYGVNVDTYQLLNELLPGVIDFSYCGGVGNMCHITKKQANTFSHYSKYGDIGIFPNAQFVAFDLLGKKKYVGIDCSEMSITEFKEFINQAAGRDFVLTMHSWNFINKYFWNKKYVGKNRVNDRLFHKMVKVANQYGYQFENINDFNFNTSLNQKDFLYNACNTFLKKIRSIGLNFWRFQEMSKISKKYGYIYMIFYLSALIILIYFIYKMRVWI